MEESTQKAAPVSLSARLGNFIQQRRKALLIATGAAVAAVIAVASAVSFVDASRMKAVAKVEALVEKYDAIRVETDEAKRDTQSADLIAELESLAKGMKGYASARALNTVAGIRADRKEWAEAEKAWVSVADATPDSYLAPVALYNAAASAEERGDIARAIELYTRCADTYAASFPLAPRAYLAIGRLNEERKDTAAAVAAYRKIVEKWPSDNWTKLANSRILSLASAEK